MAGQVVKRGDAAPGHQRQALFAVQCHRLLGAVRMAQTQDQIRRAIMARGDLGATITGSANTEFGLIRGAPQ